MCDSFNIKSDPATGWPKLVSDYRKCQHLYHYMIHPVFGFMHARLQPFDFVQGEALSCALLSAIAYNLLQFGAQLIA